jgi:hypothetical protein
MKPHSAAPDTVLAAVSAACMACCFALVYSLPILLLVLLNLPASILDGHVLRMRYRLSCALARLCRLLRVASDGRSHGRDGCVSQCGRIVSRDRAPQRLVN